MRVLRGRAAEARVRALEQRGATDLAKVEKQVSRTSVKFEVNCDGRKAAGSQKLQEETILRNDEIVLK